MQDFYDQLSPFYHLIYKDWEASMAWQAERLRDIIQRQWGESVESVLDVSCGIGTQAIGLAALGFQVTGSDLSPEAVGRAKKEAELRGRNIPFSVCDMRQAHTHHGQGFDVVLSADNSIPHLLSDEDILVALRQMVACLRIGGGCILTIRNYDNEDRGKGIMKPYGIRDEGSQRYLIWQVWDFAGELYTLSLYLVEDDLKSGVANSRVMRSKYYAIRPNHLLALMKRAGFAGGERLDNVFFQPVFVGTKMA